MKQIINDIENAMDSLSGEEIANIYNEVCIDEIIYNGNNTWRKTKRMISMPVKNILSNERLTKYLNIDIDKVKDTTMRYVLPQSLISKFMT